MKVSVAFGDKRVVVPCKDGTLSVRELIDEAVRRYRKTNALKLDSSCTILSSDQSEINVYGIESLDGAIYDLDDRVCDVADDKETLVALFHENVNAVGDCASSADGGNSSEHFTSSLTNTQDIPNTTHRLSSYSQPDTHQYSEVFRAKSEDILNKPNSGLSSLNESSACDVTVDKSSPSQNQHNHSLDYILHDSIDPSPMLPPKYGGGILRGDRVGTGANKQQQSHAQIPLSRTDGDLHRLNISANSAAPSSGPLKDSNLKPVAQFRRTFGTEASPRLTTKANSDLVDRWLTSQMAKNVAIGPAYQPNTQDFPANESDGNSMLPFSTTPNEEEPLTDPGGGGTAQPSSMYRVVNIVNDNELLGIQVVAQYEKSKQPVASAENASLVAEGEVTAVKSIAVGLLVRHVNEGGKAHSQALLFPGDLITEINGRSLYAMTFDRAQDVFKEALKTPSLSLRVVNASIGAFGGGGGGNSAMKAQGPPSKTTTSGFPHVTPSDTSSITSSFCSPTSVTHNATNLDAPQLTNRPFSPPVNGSATLPNRRRSAGAQNTPYIAPSAGPTGQHVGGGNSDPVSSGHVTTTPGPSSGDKTFHFESPLSLMNRANTKKIGRKIRVQLLKGADGLGFSLTARDNSGPLNASSPVYIKKILKKGAAIEDGRLMEGDRLLEVNGTTVTGMSQNEVVAFLRAIPQSHSADILVSRHEVEDVPREITNGSGSAELQITFPEDDHRLQVTNDYVVAKESQIADGVSSLPRIMTMSECNDSEAHLRLKGGFSSANNNHDDSSFASMSHSDEQENEKRTVLNYVIPLNDTGSAGLGISVKGRTQRDLGSGTSQDTGVFIKAILNGGAAWKDGRLLVNDQLLSVNEQSLVGMDNKDAIEVLKNSLIHHGKTGQANFRVTISRLDSISQQLRHEGSQFGESSDTSVKLITYPNNSQSLPRSANDPGGRQHWRSTEEGHGNSMERRSPRPRSRPDLPHSSDMPDGTAFSREDIHRRSLSEKRTGGRVRDANELAFYREKIKPMKDAALGDAEPSSMRRAGSCDQILDAVSSRGGPFAVGATTGDDSYWLPKRKRDAMVLPESAADTLLLFNNTSSRHNISSNNSRNNNTLGYSSRARSRRGAVFDDVIPWAPITPAGGTRRNQHQPQPGYYMAHQAQLSGGGHGMDRYKSASLESLTHLGAPEPSPPPTLHPHPQYPLHHHVTGGQHRPVYPPYHQVPSHAVAREERRSRGCSEEAPPPVQPRRNSNADAPPIPARRTKPPPVNFHNVDAPRSHNHTVQFQVQQRGVVPPPSPSYEVGKHGRNKENVLGQKWTDSPNLSSKDNKKNKSSGGGIFRGLFSPTSDLDSPIMRPRSPSSTQRRLRPPPSGSGLRTNKKNQQDNKDANSGNIVNNSSGNSRSSSAPMRPQSAMPPSAPSTGSANRKTSYHQPIHGFQSEEPAAIFVSHDKMREAPPVAHRMGGGVVTLNTNNMHINPTGVTVAHRHSPHRTNASPSHSRNSYHSPMSSASPTDDIHNHQLSYHYHPGGYNSARSSVRRDSNSSSIGSAAQVCQSHSPLAETGFHPPVSSLSTESGGRASNGSNDVSSVAAAAAYFDRVYTSNLNNQPTPHYQPRKPRASLGMIMGFGKSSNKNSSYATLPNHPNIKFKSKQHNNNNLDKRNSASSYQLNSSCNDDVFTQSIDENIFHHKSDSSYPTGSKYDVRYDDVIKYDDITYHDVRKYDVRSDAESGDQSDKSWSPMKENVTYGTHMSTFYDSANTYQSLPRKRIPSEPPDSKVKSKNRYVKNGGRKSTALDHHRRSSEIRSDSSEFEDSRRDYGSDGPPTYGAIGAKNPVSEYSLGSHSSEAVLLGDY